MKDGKPNKEHVYVSVSLLRFGMVGRAWARETASSTHLPLTEAPFYGRIVLNLMYIKFKTMMGEVQYD
jgi:hypothetical protein